VRLWPETLSVPAARSAHRPAILDTFAAWPTHGREGVLPALLGPCGLVNTGWTSNADDRAAIERLL
jgi:hypothetical protein